MGKLLSFLFGKGPQIFDRNGQISHNLPQQKWDNWHKRYQNGQEFNWKNHTGMKAGSNKEG